MGIRKHIVITGTGRSGTTLLVDLLTHLGLDTGFQAHETDAQKDKVSNAGLEFIVGETSSPYIVKDPSFVDYANAVLSRDDILVEHVFIPMRDISDVASSRRANQKVHFSKLSLRERWRYIRQPYKLYGGLLYTSSWEKGVQEDILVKKLYELLLSLARYHIPVTIIEFPYFISHPKYLFKKLSPLVEEIPYENFLTVFESLVDPSKPRIFHSKK